jgi:hypothetical protein
MSEWTTLLESFDRVEPSTMIPAHALQRAEQLRRRRGRAHTRRAILIAGAAAGVCLVLGLLALAAHTHSHPRPTPASPTGETRFQRGADDAVPLVATTNSFINAVVHRPYNGWAERSRGLQARSDRVRRDLTLVGAPQTAQIQLPTLATLARRNPVALSLMLVQTALERIGLSDRSEVTGSPFLPPPTSHTSPAERLSARYDAVQVGLAAAEVLRYRSELQNPSPVPLLRKIVELNQAIRLVVVGRAPATLAYVYTLEGAAYRQLRAVGLFGSVASPLALNAWEHLAILTRMESYLGAHDNLNARQNRLLGTLRGLRLRLTEDSWAFPRP